MARAVAQGVNLRKAWGEYVSISLDETTTRDDIALLWSVFAADGQALPSFDAFEKGIEPLIPTELRRTSDFLTHPVFDSHHSETGMLRYIRSLSDKDLALDRSMIPLGSCTMKLNATSEMIPITWPEFAGVHPFAPADQLQGYRSWTSSCAPGCARPRATPASACSPTPARRANTPACWPSRPTTPRAAKATATSA
jgi:glycine dehydrogenase